MPEYLSPGVYVEEIDSGPRPIAPVATSTAGAVGVTQRGPSDGPPRLLTSFADYQRTYGGFLAVPDDATQAAWTTQGGHWWFTAESVKAFFDEGGARMFFQRVVPRGALTSGTLYNGGLIAVLDGDVTPDATVLRLNHTVGIADNTDVVLTSGTGVALATRRVAAVDPAARTVTLTAAAGVAARRDVDMVVIPPAVAPPANAAPANVLRVEAASAGAWGDDLSVRIVPGVSARLRLAVAGPAILTSTTADAAAAATTVAVGAVTGFGATTPAAGLRLRLGQASVAVTRLAAGAGAVTVTLAAPLAAAVPAGTPVAVLRPAVTGNTVLARGAGRLYPSALVQLEGAAGREVLSVVRVDGTQVTLSAAPANAYVEDDALALVEAELSVRYAPAGGDVVTERHVGLRLVDDGSPSSIATALEQRSNLVRIRRGPDLDPTDLRRFPTAPIRLWNGLTNGNDGLDTLEIGDFVGTVDAQDRRSGIQALEAIDQVAICVVPGMWAVDVRNALVVHCETLGDRFAVLDPPPGLTVQEVLEFRSPIDTTFAALYYPWLRIGDTRSPNEIVVPPSTFVAGIYARVDVAQGVHKAPANEVIRSARSIERPVTKRQQDLLNPEGINVLRAFPGRGNRVWGARVVTDNAAWRYVPVRRLFLMVEESIDEATQWTVFEPNDEPLWARLRLSVTNFLRTLWRSGALQGVTEAQAFFVTCDRSTMTQDDIDNGRLICRIGIAPVKPAEFVIFRIQQKTLELTRA